MPNDDFDRVFGLMTIALSTEESNEALVHQAVTTLGPAAAAQIVPTLEVYPFYQPMAKGHSYQPDDLVRGVPVARGCACRECATRSTARARCRRTFTTCGSRSITRAASRSAPRRWPESVANGNPSWPCTGGCSCHSKTCGLVPGTASLLPGIAAFAFAMRRRKRRVTLSLL